MPVQSGKSALFQKYGPKLDGAVRKHADDETDYGFQRLPPGINGGVARLTSCGFEQFKQGSAAKRADGGSAVGEWYFTARGVVVEPKEAVDPVSKQVMRTAGMQTSIIEALCDTRKADKTVVTTEEHVANILNTLRMLGADTRGCTGEHLEDLAAAVKDAAPYFKYSTSAGTPTDQFPNPRTWENWHGTRGLEDYAPPDTAAGAVDDHTAAPATAPARATPAGRTPARNGTPAPTSRAAPTAPTRAVGTPAGRQRQSVVPTDVGQVPEEFNEFEEPPGTPADAPTLEELDDLVAAADGLDEDATNRILELADVYSVRSQAEASQSWGEAADIIREAAGQQGDAGEAQEEEGETAKEQPAPPPTPAARPWSPKKGEVYRYRPVDPKTKRQAKKPVDHEVLAVNAKARTMDLKDLDTQAVCKGVAWDALEKD